MNDEKRTVLIIKADRLAKRVNDNLDYLYRTSPEHARIAEKAIMSYNKGLGDVKISPKTGKIQVSRSYSDLTVKQIENRINRVERILESKRTSAKGFAEVAETHRQYWENFVREQTGKENLKLTKSEGKWIGEAFAGIAPGKYDSDDVQQAMSDIKRFSDKASFLKYVEEKSGIPKEENLQVGESGKYKYFDDAWHVKEKGEWKEWTRK